MCLLEQEVVNFCKSYLVVNKEAFRDQRLEVVINDARFDNLIVCCDCCVILKYILIFSSKSKLLCVMLQS